MALTKLKRWVYLNQSLLKTACNRLLKMTFRGVLKNALDLMSFEHLDGKVVGAISVLGGQSNSNALNDLRTIARWVHAWVIPEQVAIGQAWQAFNENGQLVDAKLAERLDKFVFSLVENTRKLRG
jgi:FMN reductase